MYMRIREFIEAQANTIAVLLTGTVLVLWIVSRFVPSLAAWVRTENLLQVIILALVAEVWAVIVGLKLRGPDHGPQLFRDQNEASINLERHIFETRPDKARLLELSAATVESVLQALVKVGCGISLLVQHPDVAITAFQEARIEQRLLEMKVLHFGLYSKVEVRLYSVPGALRGRLIGNDLVSVGWYTYSNDEIGIYGHDNPVLNARTDTPDGARLKIMMERAFRFLWDHEKTITLKQYYESLQDKTGGAA